MPFGIPSEDFHSGFGIPHDEDNAADVRTKGQKRLDAIAEYIADDYDDLTDEECAELAEEVHDNLIRSLVEAGGEVRELRELLKLANKSLLYMLILDQANKGLLNEKGVAALYMLQSDRWSLERVFENFNYISEYLEKGEEET